MKKIIYYITDHGRGHATRSIAIIRELKNQKIDVIVRNSNVIPLLQRSLPETRIIKGITDVGPVIKNDGVSTDVKKTRLIMKKWFNELDQRVNLECERISKIAPDLIVSDIPIIPFLAAKKLNKNSIAISNFSWYDVLKMLTREQLEILKNAYDKADFAIQLTMGTSMNHFKTKKKVGLVCRRPINNRHQIRKILGIDESNFVVCFALGNWFKKQVICKANKNVKFLSMGTPIKNNENVINVSNWIEGQEMVAASDLVICKCGYGIISECLTNGIPFYYIDNEIHLEQKGISDKLSRSGFRNRITFDQINHLNFIDKQIGLTRYPKKPFDTISAIKYMKEFLKN